MEGEEHQEFNERLKARGILPSNATWVGTAWHNRKYKFFWRRRCGKHVVYRTKAAVRKNPACLSCPLCDSAGIGVYKKCGRATPVGKLEPRLWRMLDHKSGLAWSLHDRIEGWKGGVDACVHLGTARRLCIQVDGMTHKKKCMSDKRNQPAIDARFNSVATAAGYSVLRLEEDHSECSWQAALDEALSACRDTGAPARVMRSRG